MAHDAAEEIRHEIDARQGAVPLLSAIFDDLEANWARVNAGQSHEADAPATPTAELGAVIDRLDERAFGLMLLLLALPCCLPFVYVLPQIVSVPMLALAGQMAGGRESPWLPRSLKSREFEISRFRDVVQRSEKYVGWFEAIARPRLTVLTGRAGARIVGALLLVPIASIMVPLPGTNSVPGVGVSIASLGLIERDGLLVILGLIIGLCWVAMLAFFGLEAASMVKDWLSALL